MKDRKWVLGCLMSLFLTVACGSTEPPEGAESERFELRVSLYPWVPNAESLVKWIEADFESRHRDIDLVIRPLRRSEEEEGNPEYIGDLAYEIDKAVDALTKDIPDSQHLVEIDTMILGSLIEQGAVSPFGIPDVNFHPAAIDAVTWKGTVYGVPHWTCGYFVISENESIRRAGNVDELLSTLEFMGTERVDLVGDLDGSWDSVMVYLDAFRDTYPDRDMTKEVSKTDLDPIVAASLRAIGESCSREGQSFCGTDGVDLFASGGADALIGYSERLNSIFAKAGKTLSDLHLASAALGGGDEPTLFTDALVLSPRCSTTACRIASQKFAAYYVSNEVFEVLLMGGDTGTPSIPRYLLPSTTSSFDFGKVANDPLYRELKVEIVGARPYPNSGVPEARDKGIIRKRVKQALAGC